jgi:hypothetical protein
VALEFLDGIRTDGRLEELAQTPEGMDYMDYMDQMDHREEAIESAD